jgi:ABC-type antimicrobial peptide transport system permease subunit
MRHRLARTVDGVAPQERGILKIAAIAIAAILLAGGLGIGFSAQLQANDAANKTQAACVAYKNIAEAPLQKNTTVIGLKLLADFRYAYIKAGCQLGKLSPPDPRVLPYIPKDPK